jgi:hypothetical protein
MSWEGHAPAPPGAGRGVVCSGVRFGFPFPFLDGAWVARNGNGVDAYGQSGAVGQAMVRARALARVRAT